MTTTRPVIPLLSAEALADTARTIRDLQLPSGMIAWFPEGHSDPWNHVEAAMALDVIGDPVSVAAATRAYRWLTATQHADGGWHAYYTTDGVEDPRRDTNVCAYVATGVWAHFVVTADAALAEELWPMVENAMDFVLRYQLPGGEVIWNVDEIGTDAEYALVTGSSSIYFSLRCAVALAESLGRERPDWELAAGRVRHAVAFREDEFEPKRRFAMDWYYPVLTGALTGPAARERLLERWDEFVMAGHGVRCVNDSPWVTTAETAECAIACMSVGMEAEARLLMEWVAEQRGPDGSYSTGLVYPDVVTFPPGERSSYSAAAVILAVDAICGTSPLAGLFRGEGLPGGLDLDSMEIEDPA